jgi:hypothetical protein
MKKSELRNIIKEEIIKLKESSTLDDMQVATQLSLIKKIDEDEADRIIGYFRDEASFGDKQKYWNNLKQKKYKAAANIVAQWNRHR